HATALSLLRDDVPAVHYQLVDFGGRVRVAEYATYGTAELAESMSVALAGRTGCVLRNHGTVTIGQNLRQAYTRCRQLGWLCQLSLTSWRVVDPWLLDGAEVERVAAQFADCGQRRPGGR